MSLLHFCSLTLCCLWLCNYLLIYVHACLCVFIFSRRRPHLPKSWALRWVDQQLHSKKDPKGLFLLIMKFFLDSDWCAIILSRPCSSCYGNLAVVMVSLFSQLSVMTHSARSAPNIAYRCYLLNFEKPLGKLRSWARFQAFSLQAWSSSGCQVKKASSLSSSHSRMLLYVFTAPLWRYATSKRSVVF